MRSRLLPIVLLCALAGCAPRLGNGGAARSRSLDAAGAAIRIHYLSEDEGAAREVAHVLARSAQRAQRWGRLDAPITITIHPSHAALEEAVHRPGHAWLRGWARYASIDLQSPRSWSPRTWAPWTWLLKRPDRRQVEELLTHELTHCAMYQAAASAASWPHASIPLWFREGMASVTAEQGHRRVGPESIRRFYAELTAPEGKASPRVTGREERGTTPVGAERKPAGGAGGDGSGQASRGDPLSDPGPLYQGEADLVYGTAHLAFEFLQARYGESRIRRVLVEMREGRPFPDAFGSAIGISVEEFEADFRRYIVWGGWRERH